MRRRFAIVLALAAMAVVRWIIPAAARNHSSAAQEAGGFAAVLRNPDLARLNFGIFALQGVLMALFVVVPFELRSAGLPAAKHWEVYLPVMLGSVALMVPPMIVAERRGRQKGAFLGAIAVLLIGEIGLVLGHNVSAITASLLLFFAGFNLLEAALPSLISRTAPPGAKGAAAGVYSSMQFLGSCVGGVAGGFISQRLGAAWVFGFCCAVTLIWLTASWRMRVPRSDRTRSYPVPRLDPKRADGLSRKLADVPGVREALVLAGEGVAHLKVDSARFDEQSVLELIAGET